MPAVQHNSVGPNFLSGTEPGTSVPLSDFFIASPSTPERQIQAALDQGRNLVLTPGVYDLNAANSSQPSRLDRPGPRLPSARTSAGQRVAWSWSRTTG